MDTGSSFLNTFGRLVDNLACPRNSDHSCLIAQRNYDVTLDRQLFNGSTLPEYTLNQLDEVDSIFSLAAQGFYKDHFLLLKNVTKGYEFTTRTATVSTEHLSSRSKSVLLTVEPGKNKSLIWIPFVMYSAGILGDCSNTSLNGLEVTAISGYMALDSQNQSALAGTWSAGTSEINGARHLGGSFVTVAVLMASVAIAGLVL
jgi:hypothetical protein